MNASSRTLSVCFLAIGLALAGGCGGPPRQPIARNLAELDPAVATLYVMPVADDRADMAEPLSAGDLAGLRDRADRSIDRMASQPLVSRCTG